MTVDSIKKIIQHNVRHLTPEETDTVAATIAKALSVQQTIATRIADIQRAVRDSERQYENAKIKLREALVQVQKQCPHMETTFYGDAAGGSDSHTLCDLCGAEIRKVTDGNAG